MTSKPITADEAELDFNHLPCINGWYMRNLHSTKLHTLLSGQTVWTDELWEASLACATTHTTTIDAQAMYRMIYPGDSFLVPLTKGSFLLEFRQWPPTVLLGAFDLMRSWKELQAQIDRGDLFPLSLEA